jgi:hypothetical protein
MDFRFSRGRDRGDGAAYKSAQRSNNGGGLH